MGSHWTGKWAGGRIREVHGRQVWCIQRRYGGRRYDFALEAKSELEVLAELALFERNPPAYRTRRQLTLAQVDDAPVGCDQVDPALAQRTRWGGLAVAISGLLADAPWRKALGGASARVRLSTPAHRPGDGDGHRAYGYDCERDWSFK